MIEVVQKIWMQGSSAVITMPRKLLYKLHAEPGDFVQFLLDEDTRTGTFRLWGKETIGRSPGIIVPDPPKVSR